MVGRRRKKQGISPTLNLERFRKAKQGIKLGAYALSDKPVDIHGLVKAVKEGSK